MIRSIAKNMVEGYLERTSALRLDPDFIIIGTQRGGTTSLYRYLATHPGVAPTLVSKGVHYFDVAADRSFGWYRGHFPLRGYRTWRQDVMGQRLITGEASPYYLFHPAVPGRIAAALPGVKVIAMLRDPVKRAYSHYQHEREGGYEDLETFEEAIDAEEARLPENLAARLEDPSFVSFEHQHHSYLSRGMYAAQMQRWFSHLPREQVLTITSEGFYRDTQATWSTILEFLGLPPAELMTTKAFNAHTYEPMDEGTEQRLRARFEGPNRELAELLGWDPGWRGQTRTPDIPSPPTIPS